MKKLELEINGSNFQDIEGFYEELNRLVMQEENWKLGASLDAFNDLLYGGFGVIKDYDELEINWLNSEKSKGDLGVEMTKSYYQQKLKHPETYNSEFVQEKLEELEAGNGQTYFEILLEIISEHPKIELNLK